MDASIGKSNKTHLVIRWHWWAPFFGSFIFANYWNGYRQRYRTGRSHQWWWIGIIIDRHLFTIDIEIGTVADIVIIINDIIGNIFTNDCWLSFRYHTMIREWIRIRLRHRRCGRWFQLHMRETSIHFDRWWFRWSIDNQIRLSRWTIGCRHCRCSHRLCLVYIYL